MKQQKPTNRVFG